MRKIFFLFISMLLVLSCGSNSKEGTSTRTCVQPAFLSPGDKVAIISPSFGLTDTLGMSQSCQVLRDWGLEPVLGKYVFADVVRDSLGRRLEIYSGTAEQRAEDLKWALEDDSIKAVLCSRGGYGSVQLLDLVPLSTFSDHPKWISGFSDITTLLSASTVAGVMSIHGNSAVAFGEEEGGDEYCRAVRDILFGNVPSYHVEPNVNDIQGHAEGMLVGGNMITLEAIFGTEYDATKYDGIVLFVEEVEENYHAIERFLNSLEVHGRLPNIRGIIVGNMRHCTRDMLYQSAYDLIGEYVKKWNIPTTFGLKCGHGPNNLPLVMGSPVSVDITSEGSDIVFNLK